MPMASDAKLKLFPNHQFGILRIIERTHLKNVRESDGLMELINVVSIKVDRVSRTEFINA